MSKIIEILVGLSVLLGILLVPVWTKATTDSSSLEELIEILKQKIEELKVQIENIKIQIETARQAQTGLKGTVKDIKQTLKLTKRLQRGMRGEDVITLQEMLATDPEIYPEGLVTGYFGPLTWGAVKRFQKKMGVEQVGIVGPKTFAKINELLAEGAGSSGKVPPGLLIAPGIRKKIVFIPQLLPGQILPPGIAKKLGMATSTPDDGDGNGDATSTPDIIFPVMSELIAASTTATSTRITWLTDEVANSNIWYGTSTSVIGATSTIVISSSDLVLNHDLELVDLNATTTYYYMVSSSDEAGNTATSSEQSFATLAE